MLFRRVCCFFERGRAQALPDEESAGVTGGESVGVSALLPRSRMQSPPPVMPALDSSGNTSSRPSDNVSSCLSPPAAAVIATAAVGCSSHASA